MAGLRQKSMKWQNKMSKASFALSPLSALARKSGRTVYQTTKGIKKNMLEIKVYDCLKHPERHDAKTVQKLREAYDKVQLFRRDFTELFKESERLKAELRNEYRLLKLTQKSGALKNQELRKKINYTEDFLRSVQEKKKLLHEAEQNMKRIYDDRVLSKSLRTEEFFENYPDRGNEAKKE